MPIARGDQATFGTGGPTGWQKRCVFICNGQDGLCPVGYSCQNNDCVAAE